MYIRFYKNGDASEIIVQLLQMPVALSRWIHDYREKRDPKYISSVKGDLPLLKRIQYDEQTFI